MYDRTGRPRPQPESRRIAAARRQVDREREIARRRRRVVVGECERRDRDADRRRRPHRSVEQRRAGLRRRAPGACVATDACLVGSLRFLIDTAITYGAFVSSGYVCVPLTVKEPPRPRPPSRSSSTRRPSRSSPRSRSRRRIRIRERRNHGRERRPLRLGDHGATRPDRRRLDDHDGPSRGGFAAAVVQRPHGDHERAGRRDRGSSGRRTRCPPRRSGSRGEFRPSPHSMLKQKSLAGACGLSSRGSTKRRNADRALRRQCRATACSGASSTVAVDFTLACLRASAALRIVTVTA